MPPEQYSELESDDAAAQMPSPRQEHYHDTRPATTPIANVLSDDQTLQQAFSKIFSLITGREIKLAEYERELESIRRQIAEKHKIGCQLWDQSQSHINMMDVDRHKMDLERLNNEWREVNGKYLAEKSEQEAYAALCERFKDSVRYLICSP